MENRNEKQMATGRFLDGRWPHRRVCYFDEERSSPTHTHTHTHTLTHGGKENKKTDETKGAREKTEKSSSSRRKRRRRR